MFRKHKMAIIISVFMLIIAIVSSINFYLMLENLNTRDDRVRKSVEQVLESVKKSEKIEPVQAMPPVYIPVKGVDYSDGKDGSNGKNGTNGKDGTSVKGDTGSAGIAGVNGKDGHDGLTLEIRCNTRKNRWETRYVGDLTWQIMNNEVVRCTTESKEN